MATMPNWVKRNPERYLKRLGYESEMLANAFPGFALMTEGDVLFAEGDFVTVSRNKYRVRAYYPPDYPYSQPTGIIADPDVVQYCSLRPGGEFHNYGYSETLGGIKLCLLNPSDTNGQGWLPDFSVVTILNLAAAWLHAYEVKRVTGEWILPEAHS